MTGNFPPPVVPSGDASAGDGPSEYIRPPDGGSQEISRQGAADARPAALLSGIEVLAEAQCSSTRLEETLRRALRVATDASEARWGCVWLYEEETERLRLMASLGTDAASCKDPVTVAGAVADRALRQKTPVQSWEGDSPAGGCAILALPIIVFDRRLGALAVGERRMGTGRLDATFDAEDRRSLRILGLQAGMAMQQARLSDEVREANRRLQEIQRMLLQSERLAALGEMSAKLAHEIRNPLSGIGGFARRIEKGLAQDDPNRQYASIVVREIQRLETLLNEQLLFAQRSHPHLAPVDLGALARETVHLVREEAEAKGVRLLEHYQGTLQPMLLDGDRVKQVILNIMKNAIASTRQGNRIRLATRAADGWAQIEIANDGDRLPGEILDSLFIPFATARSRGCGLGLAVADQIVKEHGGEIRVRSSDEWSVLFVVSLPILGNAERRKNPERRRGRERRRAA
jgi:signal transduction histidine kinase